jgi:hypothetical protein
LTINYTWILKDWSGSIDVKCWAGLAMGALARRERFATVMSDPTASGSLVIPELRFSSI